MPFSSFRERGEALLCIDDRLCRFRVPRYAGFRERRAAPFRVRAKRPSTKQTQTPEGGGMRSRLRMATSTLHLGLPPPTHPPRIWYNSPHERQ